MGDIIDRLKLLNASDGRIMQLWRAKHIRENSPNHFLFWEDIFRAASEVLNNDAVRPNGS